MAVRYVMFAGDSRVNQNAEIAVSTVAFMRLHNSLANELSAINPDWTDQTLFQEARRIVIAILQHITYAEYLPILLGKKNRRVHLIRFDSRGFAPQGSKVRAESRTTLSETAIPKAMFFDFFVNRTLHTRATEYIDTSPLCCVALLVDTVIFNFSISKKNFLREMRLEIADKIGGKFKRDDRLYKNI